jgi:hypothetical protein
VTTGADLGQQLGLDLLGRLQGCSTFARYLAADVALAASEGVAAGVDLDLEPSRSGRWRITYATSWSYRS